MFKHFASRPSRFHSHLLESLESRLLMSGSGQHLVFVGHPVSTTADGTQTVELMLRGPDGGRTISSPSEITLSVTKNGHLEGTLTATITDGVAIFTDVQETVAGKYKLVATDMADGDLKTTSSAFTISPAAFSQIATLNAPTSVVEGNLLKPFTVELLDAYGNLIKNSGGQLQLSAFPPPDNISFSSTTTTSIFGITNPAIHRGIAKVSLLGVNLGLSDSAGDATIYISTGGSIYTSIDVTTEPPAAQLVVTQAPTTLSANHKFSIQVQQEDANDNIVTNDDTPIIIQILSSSNSSYVLKSITVTPVNGIITFPDLVIGKAGEYSLSIQEETRSLDSPYLGDTVGRGRKHVFLSYPDGASTTVDLTVTPRSEVR